MVGHENVGVHRVTRIPRIGVRPLQVESVVVVGIKVCLTSGIPSFFSSNDTEDITKQALLVEHLGELVYERA